jgi:hypothetical protein
MRCRTCSLWRADLSRPGAPSYVTSERACVRASCRSHIQRKVNEASAEMAPVHTDEQFRPGAVCVCALLEAAHRGRVALGRQPTWRAGVQGAAAHTWTCHRPSSQTASNLPRSISRSLPAQSSIAAYRPWAQPRAGLLARRLAQARTSAQSFAPATERVPRLCAQAHRCELGSAGSSTLAGRQDLSRQYHVSSHSVRGPTMRRLHQVLAVRLRAELQAEAGERVQHLRTRNAHTSLTVSAASARRALCVRAHIVVEQALVHEVHDVRRL